jgi:hypothetical protein
VLLRFPPSRGSQGHKHIHRGTSRCYQKAEIEKWWPIIKAAGIQAE